MKRVLVFVLVSLLSGCGKHASRTKKCSRFSSRSSLSTTSPLISRSSQDAGAEVSKKWLPADSIRLAEAKFADIPSLVHAEPVTAYFENSDVNTTSCCFLGYHTAISKSELHDFFTKEMERLGWQEVFTIHAYELLALFEKPSKWCGISYRPGIGKKKKQTANLVIAYTLKSHET